MAEYNFWDDRTTECNDSYFCPIINCYCSKIEFDECSDCLDYIRYNTSIENEDKQNG